MLKNNSLKPGDTVRLKSGGRPFTITRIQTHDDKGQEQPAWAHVVHGCYWCPGTKETLWTHDLPPRQVVKEYAEMIVNINVPLVAIERCAARDK